MTEQRESSHGDIPSELVYAGELLAELRALRRDADLCDVFLQAENTVDVTTNEILGKAMGEARNAESNKMTNKALHEAVIQEADKEANDAHGVYGVWAHRAVLTAASPYFRAMFLGKFKETMSEVIILKGVDLDTLRTVIEYIYSPSSLVVTTENVQALLGAATQLVVRGVRLACCKFMLNALTSDNALGIRAFATMHDCTALATAANDYISKNLERVLQADEMLLLTHEELAALFSSDRLAISSEEQVLDAVLRWTQHNPEDRQKHLMSLLNLVRLEEVPRKMLVERFKAEPLAKAESRVQLKIMQSMVPDRQPPLSLVVIGGWTTDGCSNNVLAYQLPTGRCYLAASRPSCWRGVAALPAARATIGAALLDDRVYALGGWDGTAAMNSVFVYNAATNSWSRGPTMTTCRKWPGVATLGGRLYAAGGWNGSYTNSLRFSSVEALDPREGVWRPVAPMTMRRSALGAAALGDRLYGVGGYDGNSLLNFTERFDPTANRWEPVEAMAKRRSGAGVVVVGDTLYTVGGWGGGSTPLRSMERYRPNYGWDAAPPMTTGRYNVAAAAHGDRLYIAGGRADHMYATGVSVYEPATSTWSELPALPTGRDVAAAVVVPWTQPLDV